MSGASVEELLGLWADGLRDVKARLRPLFAHASVAGLGGGLAGMGCWGRSGARRAGCGQAAGDAGPWRQQAVLGRSRWDAEAPRDLVRDYAVETRAAPDAVLVIDETGLLKQGKASCGVHRQYTGSAGKITNCQIGVFAAYVAEAGHAFIDRRLYLPRAWTGAPDRLAAAHVPEDVSFATKPRLAVGMIERVSTAAEYWSARRSKNPSLGGCAPAAGVAASFL